MYYSPNQDTFTSLSFIFLLFLVFHFISLGPTKD